jgi:hypothetical protein
MMGLERNSHLYEEYSDQLSLMDSVKISLL